MKEVAGVALPKTADSQKQASQSGQVNTTTTTAGADKTKQGADKTKQGTPQAENPLTQKRLGILEKLKELSTASAAGNAAEAVESTGQGV